jgi:hypothetical protein
MVSSLQYQLLPARVACQRCAALHGRVIQRPLQGQHRHIELFERKPLRHRMFAIGHAHADAETRLG